ncbi:unnamed protein product [Amoebophrya sp. A120]|nr:unnamed protein product [Amoebophrya sp. A120]|eukprot:GSA120T00006461001.1
MVFRYHYLCFVEHIWMLTRRGSVSSVFFFVVRSSTFIDVLFALAVGTVSSSMNKSRIVGADNNENADINLTLTRRSFLEKKKSRAKVLRRVRRTTKKCSGDAEDEYETDKKNTTTVTSTTTQSNRAPDTSSAGAASTVTPTVTPTPGLLPELALGTRIAIDECSGEAISGTNPCVVFLNYVSFSLEACETYNPNRFTLKAFRTENRQTDIAEQTSVKFLLYDSVLWNQFSFGIQENSWYWRADPADPGFNQVSKSPPLNPDNCGNQLHFVSQSSGTTFAADNRSQPPPPDLRAELRRSLVDDSGPERAPDCRRVLNFRVDSTSTAEDGLLYVLVERKTPEEQNAPTKNCVGYQGLENGSTDVNANATLAEMRPVSPITLASITPAPTS